MKQIKLTILLTILMSMAGSNKSYCSTRINGICYSLNTSNQTATVTYGKYGAKKVVSYYDNNNRPVYSYRYDYNNEVVKGGSYDLGYYIYEETYQGDIIIPEVVISGGVQYSVTKIGDHAFQSTNITSVNIPKTITSIGEYAFYKSKNLTKVTIEDGASITIGDYAFSQCTSLEKNPIVEGVTSIGKYAFSGCPENKFFLQIPNSVKSIGENAISMNNLVSIVFGTGLQEIVANAIKYNKTIAKIIWLANTPPSGYNNIVGAENYVPNDLYTSLSNKTVYPFLSSMFEVDGVKYVPVSPSERTCDAIDCIYDTSAANINIGKTVSYKGIDMTVNEMKPYVCSGNPYIKNVNISCNNNIPQYAFKDSKITGTLTVENAGYVGDYAFENVTGSYIATINNTGAINNYAFKGSTGLTMASIGSNVTSVGVSAFQNCSNMTSGTLGSNIKSIGNYAFEGCSKLQSIDIPDAVTSLGSYAFKNCSSMISAKMGSGFSWINAYTFSGCSSLQNVQIGSNVVHINNYAFSGCSSLPSLFIPKSVHSIGNYAFNGCTKLKDVIIEDNQSEISDRYAEGSDWTIYSDKTSKSSKYTFDVIPGDILSFTYYVASATSGNLKITLNGNQIVSVSANSSNDYTDVYSTRFSETKTVELIVSYSGGGGTTQTPAVVRAKLSDFKLNDTALSLGSNGSNPLFYSCPLDSVYIGRNISYGTTSSVGYSPFYRNASLRSIEITDKETEISENEFYGCTNLKNVRIGDGVTTIGNWAFSGCASLDYFAFGSSVETVGKEAFSDCTAMTKLISRAENPPVCGTQALDDINKWNCTLTIPVGTLSKYQAADQWKEFFFIEEKDLSSINTITMDDGSEQEIIATYDLNGRKTTGLQRGMNIVKFGNGKTKKVMVK